MRYQDRMNAIDRAEARLRPLEDEAKRSVCWPEWPDHLVPERRRMEQTISRCDAENKAESERMHEILRESRKPPKSEYDKWLDEEAHY